MLKSLLSSGVGVTHALERIFLCLGATVTENKSIVGLDTTMYTNKIGVI